MRTTKAFEIELGLEAQDGGFDMGFDVSLVGKVGEITNEEDKKEISELGEQICNVIERAILRDMKENGVDVDNATRERVEKEEEKPSIEEKREFLKSLRDVLYNMLPEEDKRDIDEFNEKIDKAKDEKEKERLFKEAMDKLREE